LVRGFGWWAFRCRLDRAYHWCISPASPSSSDYGNAWVFLVPGKDAFLPTVRFEMLREGLEDHDYLTFFQQALEQSARDLHVDNCGARDTADFFAARLSDTQIMRQAVDPAVYERTRLFLGHAIEWLKQPPRACFQARPGPGGVAIFTFRAAPGVRLTVDSRPLRGSRPGLTITPDRRAAITLTAADDARAKTLRIPLR
jgi:anaerobic selenocysteine-containing dehydrogenase